MVYENTNYFARCYGARRWSGKLIPFAYGKTRRLHPCHVKVQIQFNIALLNRWLPVGKVERHGWIECKDKLTKPELY